MNNMEEPETTDKLQILHNNFTEWKILIRNVV